jgi:hypothetical protein
MTETIEKVEVRHTKNEMVRRDGETGLAVGLFVLALAIPVLFGTLYGLETPRAAVVNFVCGMVLLIIGGSATGYGWILLKRARKHDEA